MQTNTELYWLDPIEEGAYRGRMAVHVNIHDLRVQMPKVVKGIYQMVRDNRIGIVFIHESCFCHKDWAYLYACLREATLGVKLHVNLFIESREDLLQMSEILQRQFDWLTIDYRAQELMIVPGAHEIFLTEPPEGPCTLPRKNGFPIYRIRGKHSRSWVLSQDRPSDWVLEV